MKKLLLIIFILALFGTNNTFSNRYGNHEVSYSNPGGATLVGSGGPNKGTRCDGQVRI